MNSFLGLLLFLLALLVRFLNLARQSLVQIVEGDLTGAQSPHGELGAVHGLDKGVRVLGKLGRLILDLSSELVQQRLLLLRKHFHS